MDLPNSQPPTAPPNYTPVGFGERKETPAPGVEKAPIVETVPPKELGPEVKDWLTKVETGEEVQLPRPVYDTSGQVLIQPAAPQKVTVKLPLDDQGIKAGLTYKIIDSIRWLAEWCLRLIKITAGKFIYRYGREL
jgi:hypothetical protein